MRKAPDRRPEAGGTAASAHARKQALRAEFERRRQTAGADLARRRAKTGRGERRRRRWWVLGLLLLLLLFLLRDCSCSPPPSVQEAAPSVARPVPMEPAAKPPPPLPGGRIGRRDRPSFENEAPDPLPWLASLRLQVAARSPRLADCFIGVPRPGALRWSAAVEPSQGRVSDQTLEPTLDSDELTRDQRDCVLAVLVEPPYRLETTDDRSTPSRVGMVIEF